MFGEFGGCYSALPQLSDAGAWDSTSESEVITSMHRYTNLPGENEIKTL